MDLRWGNDMDLFAAETASDLEELEQDCIHVIDQDLGSNADDEQRGLGAANILSKALPGGIDKSAENQIQSDDRVTSCSSTISTDANGIVTLNLEISVNDDVLKINVPFGGNT